MEARHYDITIIFYFPGFMDHSVCGAIEATGSKFQGVLYFGQGEKEDLDIKGKISKDGGVNFVAKNKSGEQMIFDFRPVKIGSATMGLQGGKVSLESDQICQKAVLVASERSFRS